MLIQWLQLFGVGLLFFGGFAFVLYVIVNWEDL